MTLVSVGRPLGRPSSGRRRHGRLLGRSLPFNWNLPRYSWWLRLKNLLRPLGLFVLISNCSIFVLYLNKIHRSSVGGKWWSESSFWDDKLRCNEGKFLFALPTRGRGFRNQYYACWWHCLKASIDQQALPSPQTVEWWEKLTRDNRMLSDQLNDCGPEWRHRVRLG